MTELVDPTEIEGIVGVKRHETYHIARWIVDAGQIFILHSQVCVDGDWDLRECPYSQALDKGASADFYDYANKPVVVVVSLDGTLQPLGKALL